METGTKSGPPALRRAARWSFWAAAASLVVGLIAGFVGMAHKDVCLPQASHCNGDVIQTALTVLYFGSLIVLAVSVLVGLILAAIVALRAISKRHAHA